MLKAKMVDCEGWDVFSVWQGKHTRSKDQIAEEYLNSEEGKAKIQHAKDEITNLIRQYIANDGTAAAWAAYKRGLNQFPGFQLPEQDLLGLIGAMRKAGMRTVARMTDEAAPPVRPAVEAINPCSAVRPCGANQTRETRVSAG